jgi:hypothetical protein
MMQEYQDRKTAHRKTIQSTLFVKYIKAIKSKQIKCMGIQYAWKGQEVNTFRSKNLRGGDNSED